MPARIPWLVEQSPGIDTKCFCQAFDNPNAGIARCPLQIGQISPVNSRPVSQLFLAPALVLAQAAQIGGKALADIHPAIWRAGRYLH